MLVKVHNAYRMVVAICDSDLINMKFEELDEETGNIRQIDLTGNFFKGEEMSEEKIEKLVEHALNEDACFNIVGPKSCELGKKLQIIDDKAIKFIDNVPVSLVLM